MRSAISYSRLEEHVFQIDAIDVAIIDDSADNGSVALQRDDGRIGRLADLLAQRRSDGVVAGDLNGAADRGASELVAVTDLTCFRGQIIRALARTDDQHVNLTSAQSLVERRIPRNDDGSGHGRRTLLRCKEYTRARPTASEITPRPVAACP